MRTLFRITLSALLALFLHTSPASACGGLFCQNIPVDQAGEQILFHQEGDTITAMVRILYEGNSEDFSWVVPVPSTPTLSTGADAFFDELDNMTRPLFLLDRTGNGACFVDGPVFSTASDGGVANAENESVRVEQELTVGPFDIKIISSDNPGDMAAWLKENEYDLSDRGLQLIEPYVNDGMKFVAAKLRSDQSTGSIQPLIMQYKSSKPMVPIKLTAVAAQDDMGVLVWLVSNARGVPENYLHVIPNYAQLNWYTGPNNAYGSYQSLITNAMNEAGGQGFATDFAGPINSDITEFMSKAENLQDQLHKFDSLSNDAEFLASLYRGPRTEAMRAAFNRVLPLPEGQDEGVYFEQLALATTYGESELSSARVTLRQAFVDIEIDPLRASTDLLPNGRYLTRLYTTLSADEMTVDPSFVFNPEMEDQSRTRSATLEENCIANETQWSLTLGEGTGRDGETVLSGTSVPPIAIPEPIIRQSAVFSAAITSADAAPEFKVVNQFAPLTMTDAMTTTDNEGDSGSSSFLGGVSYWWLYVTLALFSIRRRTNKM